MKTTKRLNRNGSHAGHSPLGIRMNRIKRINRYGRIGQMSIKHGTVDHRSINHRSTGHKRFDGIIDSISSATEASVIGISLI